ncbi:MAG TPA: GtrA family protein [Gammaproteobacteria bacterium]|nr:GtrA family protein [Gammaproteobacteria bacterium]
MNISDLKQSSMVRYIPIGIASFIIDFTLLNIGLKLHLPLLLANGISVTTSIIFSFFMHRHFTFAHQAKKDGYSMRAHHQFIFFLIASLSALFFSELLIHLFVVTIGLSPSIAKILSSAILFIWNYAFNKVLTFRVK